ncbi:MAG: cytochrome oxidase small assembly protein [Burkholderiaceae bacterium]
MALTPEQRRKNLRLGLVLASVAFAFLAGFVAKAILFGL